MRDCSRGERFDPTVDLSPFTLFRQLREGASPTLIDLRPVASGRGLAGGRPLPADDWRPEPDEMAVLFDEDGSLARPLARRWRVEGHRVRSLFGGLRLWELCFSPEVVGTDFLEP